MISSKDAVGSQLVGIRNSLSKTRQKRSDESGLPFKPILSSVSVGGYRRGFAIQSTSSVVYLEEVEQVRMERLERDRGTEWVTRIRGKRAVCERGF